MGESLGRSCPPTFKHPLLFLEVPPRIGGLNPPSRIKGRARTARTLTGSQWLARGILGKAAGAERLDLEGATNSVGESGDIVLKGVEGAVYLRRGTFKWLWRSVGA
jgi:hypothetical protein